MTTMRAEVCVVCQRRPPEWSLCCAGCTSRMRDQLAALVDEYARLDATPGSSTGQRVSGTRTAPLPLRVDVLNLVGPGSAHVHVDRREEHDDQVGELPPLVWLDQVVRDWRDTRGQGEHLPGTTITQMTAWLDRRLDWAADEHPAIDEFAAELAGQLRTLRGVNRAGEKPDAEFVGYCPADAVDGPCGQPLYANPWYAVITCGCGAEWRRDQWEHLAATLNAASGTEGAA